MNIKAFFCAFTLLWFGPIQSYAQKSFVEGEINYIISAKSSANEPLKPTGTFTVTFKDGMIRKDIKMANGYSNTIIINRRNSSVHSLKTLADVRYAVQIDYAEHLDKHKKYEGLALTEQGASETLAGYPARKAAITYKDGTTTTIFYTPELTLEETHLFDRFPGIKYLPLVFDFVKDNGDIVHLEIQKVEAKPVETSLFIIPTDYKIISSKELKELSK